MLLEMEKIFNAMNGAVLMIIHVARMNVFLTVLLFLLDTDHHHKKILQTLPIQRFAVMDKNVVTTESTSSNISLNQCLSVACQIP